MLQNKKIIFILYMIYRLFNIKLSNLFIYNYLIFYQQFYWGLGIGDWGLGIGDWAQSPIPNPQSPIPN